MMYLLHIAAYLGLIATAGGFVGLRFGGSPMPMHSMGMMSPPR